MALKNQKLSVANNTSKTKKSIKSNVNQSNSIRTNIKMIRSLHSKVKQFVLKHNVTMSEVVTSAIKEYMKNFTVESNPKGSNLRKQ